MNAFTGRIASALFLGMLLAWPPGHAGGAVSRDAGEEPSVQGEGSSIRDRWGVDVLAIRRTAGGRMLDFRYRVEDPEKAVPLFQRQAKPRLIDHASGRALAVADMPKIGPLRSSDTPKAGRIYWMLFANTGSLVKSGNKVTVVIGDFRAENLLVE
ncbi:MAG: hypothetical protein HY900_20765 [Deltaproteobacteria bacterium]|nr:hypothetical protein [Deltaproteobacteria bacterium]